MRRVVLLLCLAQAACFVPVKETYRVNGSASELLSTARENAQKLGYQTADGADGGFTLTEYPNQHRGSTIEVTASNDELHFAGNGLDRATQPPQPLEYHLNEAAEVIARTTDAKLHRLTGPGVEPRSKLLAATLDVLVPGGGAWYALRADPYLDAPVGTGMFWLTFMTRTWLDVVAVGLSAELLTLDRLNNRPLDGWVLLGPVAVMVMNRVFALLFDLPAVSHRNAYAASGLPAPSEGYHPVTWSSIGQ